MKKGNKAESVGGGFISGVFILSLSTLIVKIIGLAFKIPMLSLLGMEGMGYFNSAYEIYAVLCVVSTAGLPVALSILISSARAFDDDAKIVKIYKVAVRIFFVLGTVGTVIMLARFVDAVTDVDYSQNIIMIKCQIRFSKGQIISYK